MAYVNTGDRFRYSVNIEPRADDRAGAGWIYDTNWNDVANRVAAATSPFATTSVVPPATDTNMTFLVVSTMDRASEQDIRGNIDDIVRQQPQVARWLASQINPIQGRAGGNGGDKPFELTPAMWAGVGLILILLLKR